MTWNISRLFRSCLLAATAIVAVSLHGAQANELIYGITRNQFLVTWKAETPANLLSAVSVSGLQQNEVILGIDFRPSTRELYMLGSTNRLYTADVDTGVVTMVGSGPFSPALNGSAHGFDFDPVQDRIRVDTDTNKNYLIDPIDATLFQESDIFYALGDSHATLDPSIVHIAYTNNIPGASSTQLYGIDTGFDVLVKQDGITGMLTTVGPLNVDMNDTGGFDISGRTGIAYMAITQAGLSRSTLWTVDLATGESVSKGRVGGGSVITAMAVAPVPEPSAVALTLLGLAAMILQVVRNR